VGCILTPLRGYNPLGMTKYKGLRASRWKPISDTNPQALLFLKSAVSAEEQHAILRRDRGRTAIYGRVTRTR